MKVKKIVFHKDYHPRFPTTKDVRRMQKSSPTNARLHSKVKPFGDRDKDGTPNFIDCYPRNPRKHGIISAIGVETVKKVRPSVGKKLERIGKWVKEKRGQYAEEAAISRERKIKTLQQEVKIAEQRRKLRKLKEIKIKKGGAGLAEGISGFSGIAGTGYGQSLFETPKRRKK